MGNVLQSIYPRKHSIKSKKSNSSVINNENNNHNHHYSQRNENFVKLFRSSSKKSKKECIDSCKVSSNNNHDDQQNDATVEQNQNNMILESKNDENKGDNYCKDKSPFQRDFYPQPHEILVPLEKYRPRRSNIRRSARLHPNKTNFVSEFHVDDIASITYGKYLFSIFNCN